MERLYGVMGFGYPLGIDLPGEKRGFIPNASVYDKAYRGSWNGLTIISISIGQGEVTLTPLQIANLGATIANRGYFITPHVVKEVEGEALDTLYSKRRYTMVDVRITMKWCKVCVPLCLAELAGEPTCPT